MFENDPAGRCRWQDQVFSALCWLVSKPLDGLDEQDASGRFTVFLQTFSSITAQSGWMEKRALFWLLKLWRISGVADVSVLKRSVQVTAGRSAVISKKFFFLLLFLKKILNDHEVNLLIHY